MPDVSPSDWSSLQQWWQEMGRRLQVEDRVEAFFRRAMGASQALAGAVQVGGEVEYILFVLVRYWIPVVLPPPAWVTTTWVGGAPVSRSISRAISSPSVSMPLTPKLL